MAPEITYAKAKEIKERHTPSLMTHRNVVGVGVGITRREEGRSWAVLVYVRKKVPVDQLKPQDLIPAELEGVPTEVVVIGEPTAFSP